MEKKCQCLVSKVTANLFASAFSWIMKNTFSVIIPNVCRSVWRLINHIKNNLTPLDSTLTASHRGANKVPPFPQILDSFRIWANQWWQVILANTFLSIRKKCFFQNTSLARRLKEVLTASSKGAWVENMGSNKWGLFCMKSTIARRAFYWLCHESLC